MGINSAVFSYFTVLSCNTLRHLQIHHKFKYITNTNTLHLSEEEGWVGGISRAAFCSRDGKKLSAKWVRISISAHQCSASQCITFGCISIALHYILMLYIAIFLIAMHWKSGSGLELVPTNEAHLKALHLKALHYILMHCVTF